MYALFLTKKQYCYGSNVFIIKHRSKLTKKKYQNNNFYGNLQYLKFTISILTDLTVFVVLLSFHDQ